MYDQYTGKKKGSERVKSKFPKKLQDILRDPEKRKKLVIYINPPYAEERSTLGRLGKKDVYKSTVHTKYTNLLAVAGRELFAQFLIRVYLDIPNCTLANFSKMKILQGSAFSDFRRHFRAKLRKLFLMPAYTFDNVVGKFPIGFFVWDTAQQELFSSIAADVYDEKKGFVQVKTIAPTDKNHYISKWSIAHKATENFIAFLADATSSDFQHNKKVRLINRKNESINTRGIWVNEENLMVAVVFLAVRHATKHTWLNDRDQFLYPNDSWENDVGFRNDCLVFALFHGQNRISVSEGINHWIPFTEKEVNAREKFDSSFMSDFIAGKIKKTNGNLFSPKTVTNGTKCRFSPLAQAVFDAGCELWRYYHAQQDGENPDTGIAFDANASLYDIREYFQGRNEKGTMNARSADAQYTDLMAVLREKMNVLADKIAVKVYEHGFLKD